MEFLNFSLLTSPVFLHLLPKSHGYAVYPLITLFLLLGMKILLAGKVELASSMFGWGR